MSNNDLLKDVAEYYTRKLHQHGLSPRGVDWNGEEGQFLRFKQLSKIVVDSGVFTLNDVGCGYGALYEFLALNYSDFIYCGIDISEDMVVAARQRFSGRENASFCISSCAEKKADYSVASGIFNVRLGRSDIEWFRYLESMLDNLNESCERGFSFNCLTSYSDADKKRDYLYYADPNEIFDLCKRRYSKDVALLHDYGLYEFTVLVRKAL